MPCTPGPTPTWGQRPLCDLPSASPPGAPDSLRDMVQTDILRIPGLRFEDRERRISLESWESWLLISQ